MPPVPIYMPKNNRLKKSIQKWGKESDIYTFHISDVALSDLTVLIFKHKISPAKHKAKHML